MILADFDPNKRAVINADDMFDKVEDFPEVCVSCFSHLTFERLCEELGAVQFDEVSNANGPQYIYKAKYLGVEIALVMSIVGAPGTVGTLEELYAKGMKKLVIFGTCGVLDKSIEDCAVIIPTHAIRDEGTSYHYAPVSDEIEVNKKYGNDFKKILEKHGVDYTEGKVWTTDAFYRETADKMKKRKDAGCVAVDMECSAVAAFAEFRDVEVFHFFYAADNLDAGEWDRRSLDNDAFLEEKDRVASLALEMAISM